MTTIDIAKDFLQLASSGKVEEAYSNYVSTDFIHHNQYFQGSREALKKAMAEAHETSPNKRIEIKQCFTDANTVITHSLVVKENVEMAVVHIFRFHGDTIVELWDLGQIIAKESPNENGLF